ncbi:MAG: hypothetical protein ACQEP2_04370 [Actinomycetota bacterium]
MTHCKIKKIPITRQIDLDLLKETDNGKFQDIIIKIIDKKYKLVAVEDFFRSLIYYQAYKAYEPYFASEMDDYIDIKAAESYRPAILDTGIAILYSGNHKSDGLCRKVSRFTQSI